MGIASHGPHAAIIRTAAAATAAAAAPAGSINSSSSSARWLNQPPRPATALLFFKMVPRKSRCEMCFAPKHQRCRLQGAGCRVPGANHASNPEQHNSTPNSFMV